MRWRVTPFDLVITCLTCDDDDDDGREREEAHEGFHDCARIPWARFRFGFGHVWQRWRSLAYHYGLVGQSRQVVKSNGWQMREGVGE